jgi:hypothetical protein
MLSRLTAFVSILSLKTKDHYFLWQLQVTTTYQPVYRTMYSYIYTYWSQQNKSYDTYTWRQKMAHDDNTLHTYIPVPFGGPEPTYSESVSPSDTLLLGIFPTSQWCHSRNLGSLRLGASGSGDSNHTTYVLKLNYVQLPSALQFTFVGHAWP